MTRVPLLAGNWKMNMLRGAAADFCGALRPDVEALAGTIDVVLFPPSVLIETVTQGVAGGPIGVGGQDVHPATSGAHTGDVSAPQLRDAGCLWVLCGHSERRRDHGESDALVGEKAKVADEHGLEPVVCLGETREERQRGETLEVLERQLLAALEPGLDKVTVAYEPVWAIGTGETATPAMAQEAHAHLRHLLARELGQERAERIRLLYGGSAKPTNVAELYAELDIDGFLVGGASLDSAQFSAMIKTCASIGA